MKKLSQKDFELRVKESRPDIKILGKYINSHSRIEVINAKTGKHWFPIAGSLYQTHKKTIRKRPLNYIPYKTQRMPQIDINDFHTLHPELSRYLLNEEDGKTHKEHSCEKVLWECPRCGENVLQSFCNVLRYGISCKKCGDGFS